MKKKGAITGGIITSVIVVIVAVFASNQTNLETINLDMDRTYGSVQTAMGSPIFGNPDAPITIVEFGDYYLFHQKQDQLVWYLV